MLNAARVALMAANKMLEEDLLYDDVLEEIRAAESLVLAAQEQEEGVEAFEEG